MTLGQKLKALLKDNSMTQEDLAERLEVSRQAVGKWVNDKGIPEVGKLVQISIRSVNGLPAERGLRRKKRIRRKSHIKQRVLCQPRDVGWLFVVQ